MIPLVCLSACLPRIRQMWTGRLSFILSANTSSNCACVYACVWRAYQHMYVHYCIYPIPKGPSNKSNRDDGVQSPLSCVQSQQRPHWACKTEQSICLSLSHTQTHTVVVVERYSRNYPSGASLLPACLSTWPFDDASLAHDNASILLLPAA